MQTQATVFLGGGRITGALIAGLRLAGYSRPIVVHDRNPEKLRALRREFRIEVARDLKSAVERAGDVDRRGASYSMAELLEEIVGCGAVSRARIAISLAAGIPLKKLRAGLGLGVRWARAMPSPVCRIGHGLTAVTYDRSVSVADRKRVRALFELVGPVLGIAEKRFDAFSVAYSPSHGYHALATLADAAQAAGLDRSTALTRRGSRLCGGDPVLERERANAGRSSAGIGDPGRDCRCHDGGHEESWLREGCGRRTASGDPQGAAQCAAMRSGSFPRYLGYLRGGMRSVTIARGNARSGCGNAMAGSSGQWKF